MYHKNTLFYLLQYIQNISVYNEYLKISGNCSVTLTSSDFGAATLQVLSSFQRIEHHVGSPHTKELTWEERLHFPQT